MEPAFLDSFGAVRHLRAVLRLFIALLLSLSLVSAPAAAQTQPVADCGMSASEMGMTDDHEQMACCTPDCTAVSAAAAVFDDSAAATNQASHSALLQPLPDFALHSISPAAADPPPRIAFV